MKKRKKKHSFFIPDEMLLRIFSFFSGEFLCNVISLVCHHWQAITQDEYLWYKITKNSNLEHNLQILRAVPEEKIAEGAPENNTSTDPPQDTNEGETKENPAATAILDVPLIRPKERSWKWVYRAKRNVFENPFKNKVNGIGHYTWTSSGFFYEGEWKDGKPHGIGIKVWAKNEYYVGSWDSGKTHGYGVYHFPDGANYDGYWKSGYHDGEGTYCWADGNKYIGSWQTGTRHGWGVRYWANGNIFEGEWASGKRTGYGTYHWPNGSKYVGEWENGSHHGYGTYTWLDGRKYYGSWRKSKKQGHGVYFWPDGCTFTGQWHDSHRHGVGFMMWSDGSRFEGEWSADKRGIGKCYDSNGQLRESWAHPKKYDNYFTDPAGTWEIKYRDDISQRRMNALQRLKRENNELPTPILEREILLPEGW
eukprot:TRINITY_DN2224_c0_g2_i1.p1 TRINITY_DN2224_c0_g2~~TRINITY_DN2224_c0_g2_i1.p1  ORF type:complete len:420 (+),score=56.03 TRINITY_DN2224_c0_g2_i1:54-1313(+)